MIPILLAVLFAAAAWLAHETWTSPVEDGASARQRRRVEEFLHRAGLHDVTPREFVLFSLAAGALAWVLAYLVMGWLLVSLVAAAVGATGPYLLYAARAEARRAQVQAELASAMTLLRDSIRSGLDVPQSLQGLATYGPPLLQPEFARAAQSMAHSNLRDALGGMRERLADPVFDACVATLLLNEHLGSSQLTAVLDELAQAVRDELRVQADLRAQRARTVLSARIIAAVPLALLIAIRAISPNYLSLFDSVEGQLILASCALSVAVGYVGMLWVARLPADERVLVQ